MEVCEYTSETIEAVSQEANLRDYEEAHHSFRWQDVEREFTWYQTGKVNMAYEAIDRHADSWRKNKVALHFTEDKWQEKYTFLEMKLLSNKFANLLRSLGIGKGDRVFVFLPRSPELYVSFMGIAKIGAIVGPLFEAFMEAAVKDRLQDSQAVAVVTTAELAQRIPVKELSSLKYIILVGARHHLNQGEISYEEEMARASDKLEIEWLDREDPLILHYTSGSTGKPKGILHVHNAMLGHYQTAKWVLDLRDDDVFWCTADPGWITGTAYGIYGPWLLGASSLIRGGRFDAEKWYATIEKHKVTVWYSAPTAFRLLMRSEDIIKKYDLSSLRLIFSVGEPLNPEVIRWGRKAFGLTILDTWWMTETGMQLITNFPSMPVKPGSMGKPVPGVEATILDETGNDVHCNQLGNLAIKTGWPAMMRAVWGNPAKYQEYFRFKSWFVTGDLACCDADGYFWFHGRADDIIKTSGERVGPFEVESKLIEHPAVAEAGVIGKPDPIKGQIIKAFISLRPGYQPSDKLKEEIIEFVKRGLAAHAAPREIEFLDQLPKTRSGKIMRRVLRATELGLPTGDLSTMDQVEK